MMDEVWRGVSGDGGAGVRSTAVDIPNTWGSHQTFGETSLLERVVGNQNEFCDSALAYFNVFFNFGVGLFSSIFVFWQFLWG